MMMMENGHRDIFCRAGKSFRCQLIATDVGHLVFIVASTFRVGCLHQFHSTWIHLSLGNPPRPTIGATPIYVHTVDHHKVRKNRKKSTFALWGGVFDSFSSLRDPPKSFTYLTVEMLGEESRIVFGGQFESKAYGIGASTERKAGLWVKEGGTRDVIRYFSVTSQCGNTRER